MSIANFTERLAGYLLLKRIGAGGYGEVWKAEAPGGLAKAVKLIYGCLGEERATRELKALQRVKEVRHPFLLSLERIDILDGQLVIITELADCSLKERFQQCRHDGLPGIPRQELLHYLRDTAEALDYMSEHFSLQHLDIKPENLLILGGRIKVGDFGLVKEIENVTVSVMGGMTPIYAAPELFNGSPSRHSDQYSLAIVYQEMLTGTLPYPGKTSTQLINQHLHNEPQLGPLPPADQSIVARALAKDPRQRFPNCQILIERLFAAGVSSPRSETSPPKERLPDREYTTTQITQVCDTKSQMGEVSSKKPPPSIPAQSFEKRGLDASLGEIASPSAPPSGDQASPEADRPSWPLSGTDSSVSDDAWLEPADKSAYRVLPPLNMTVAAPWRPVLVIGVGGAAGRILRKLQGRLREHWENDLPAFRLLLLDTDPQALGSGSTAEACDLPESAKLLLPLRCREYYHEITTQLLRWLDRRWLYNLPRSRQPEGLRPLGRLAFVDHADKILSQLRSTFVELLLPDSLDLTTRLTGFPLAGAEPEIYLVSSLGGGTGSGMIFDLAYAVKKVLAESGQEEARLYGVLTFSTPRQPEEKKLALANAHAAFRELRYYFSHDPGEPVGGLDPAAAGGGPFDEAYCIDWGEDLDDDQFDLAAERTADYLFARTLTPQRTFFAACQTAFPPPDSAASPGTPDAASNALSKEPAAAASDPSPPPAPPGTAGQIPHLKTFGLHRLSCSRRNLPRAWVDFLCRKVVDCWRGTMKNNALSKPMQFLKNTWTMAVSPQFSERSPEGKISAHDTLCVQFNLAGLLHQAQTLLEAKLPKLHEATFREMLLPCCRESALRGEEADGLSPRQFFHAIDFLLGPARSLEEWKDAADDSLQKNLLEALRDLAHSEGRVLADKILRAHEPLPSGCVAAQAEVEKCLVEIRRNEEQNRRQQERLQEGLQQTERTLSLQATTARPPKKTWRLFRSSSKPPSGLAPGWFDYAQQRRDLVLLQAMNFILQALQPQLCTLSDKLRNLQYELHRLAECFPEKNIPPAEVQDPASVPAPEKSRRLAGEQLRLKAPELIHRCLEHCRRETFLEPESASALDEETFRLINTAEKKLRSVVEEVLLDFLRPLMLEAWMQEAEAGSGKTLEGIFASAKPLLNDCGGTARILLSAPESLLEPLRETCRATMDFEPTMLPSAEENIFVCYELDQMPLPRVAAHCLKDQRELISLARRLQTRIDVVWSAPPRGAGDPPSGPPGGSRGENHPAS